MPPTSYAEYVRAFADLVEAGKHLRPAAPALPPAQAPDASAPLAMIFAPHPDDECLMGLLPRRLQCEAGWRIAVVPVTHGSRPDRQPERSRELARACAFLGWNLLPSPPSTPQNPLPPFSARQLRTLLASHTPRAVFFPHAADWNPRHITTHHLVRTALADLSAPFPCDLFETEYWGAMDDPNLLVEGDSRTVGDLAAALAHHRKEVLRNPYHLLLPAWMMDNVRRGAERISGPGQTPPPFHFACLYRHSRPPHDPLPPRHWPQSENAGRLFTHHSGPPF